MSGGDKHFFTLCVCLSCLLWRSMSELRDLFIQNLDETDHGIEVRQHHTLTPPHSISPLAKPDPHGSVLCYCMYFPVCLPVPHPLLLLRFLLSVQGKIGRMVEMLRVHDRELATHMDALGLDARYYSLRWITTLLSRYSP